jgi:hypothetical protein
MKFSKQERQELNKLSMQLFGSSSKWQKLLSKPEFRVIIETKEDETATKYVSLNNSRKQNSFGTILTLKKAIAMGLFKSEKGQEILNSINEKKVKKVLSREPSFEELKTMLIDNIDIQKLAMCDEHELATIVAYRLVHNSLNMTVVFDITEEEAPFVENIVASLPYELQERVRKLIPTKDAEKNPNALVIKGLETVKEISYILKNMEDAEKDYISLMEEKQIPRQKKQNIIEGLKIEEYISSQRRKINARLKDMQIRPEYYKKKEEKRKLKQKMKEQASAGEIVD